MVGETPSRSAQNKTGGKFDPLRIPVWLALGPDLTMAVSLLPFANLLTVSNPRLDRRLVRGGTVVCLVLIFRAEAALKTDNHPGSSFLALQITLPMSDPWESRR